MAPLKSQPAVSSQRHELLDVIQSLTQQLQKADEAVSRGVPWPSDLNFN